MHNVRHLVAGRKTSRVAMGHFERTVAMWETEPPSLISTFETILDFGGQRLTMSDGGDVVVAAAYSRGAVAAYSVISGDVLWKRVDIERIQHLNVSHSSPAVYVGSDEKPCLLLSLESGETLRQLRGVRKVIESPYGPSAFLDQARPAVVDSTTVETVFRIERTTFAFLSIAFSSAQLAVSEAGGPVRCFELSSGDLAWMFVPNDGTHCLELAYIPSVDSFVGVLWPYEKGGSKELVRFDERGITSVLTKLGEPVAECFCANDLKLLTSDGLLIDIASGDGLRLDLSNAETNSE
jgi:hypothetical protein